MDMTSHFGAVQFMLSDISRTFYAFFFHTKGEII